MSHATQLHHRGYLADYLQIMNASVLPGNVYEAVYSQVHEQVISSVKWTLEQALNEEVRAYLGRARYAHGLHTRRPEETRSGTYTRELWTQYGCIFDLCVPKLRRGNRDLQWQSIDAVCTLLGSVSGSTAPALLPWGIVCAICKKPCSLSRGRGAYLWTPATVWCWGLQSGRKPLKRHGWRTPPPIVLVDGLWLKVAVPTGGITPDTRGRKRPVKHKEKRVMLTALGIWEDGHWEILTWQLAPGDDGSVGGAAGGGLVPQRHHGRDDATDRQ